MAKKHFFEKEVENLGVGGGRRGRKGDGRLKINKRDL